MAIGVIAAWFMQGKSKPEAPQTASTELSMNGATPAQAQQPGSGPAVEFNGSSQPLPLPLVGESQPVSYTHLYIELPIQISVVGGYHDLATFVSGVSSLPRIVTLHDFEIKPVAPGSTSKLRMSILAKTYRYNDKGLKK